MALQVIARELDQSATTAADRFAYLRDGKKIALYGAGGMGRSLTRALLDAGYPVELLVDQNATAGQEVEGVPVVKADSPNLTNLRGETHMIVAVFNPLTDVSLIFKQLNSEGWFSLTSAVAMYHLFQNLQERCWLVGTQFYCTRAGDIMSAGHIWADEKSRDLYRAIIEFRLTGDYRNLPSAEPCQYFPPDLPPWSTPLRFIDCGACDGDTLQEVEKMNVTVEAIAAFEPDIENYRALVRQVRSPYFEGAERTLWPCGVHSQTTQLRFSSGLGASSGISEGGNTVVQCVSLDECIGNFRPNLMKMDIEGAEFDAMNGAFQTIARHRPGLAICVYHRPDDLWRLPNLINEWDLGYHLYLRLHAQSGFDLVLYAVQ